MEAPEHKLADLQALASAALAGGPVRVDEESLETISCLYDVDLAGARKIALEIVLELTDDGFVEPVRNYRPYLDLYGIHCRGRAWYVKIGLMLHGGVLLVQSCHPPEKDLLTRGGRIRRT